MVCVVRGLLLLLLYSARAVPGRDLEGNIGHRLEEDQIKLSAKMHLDGN